MTKPLNQPIVLELRSAGWEITHRRNGHLVATHPAAAGPVFLSATPSDSRAAAHRTRSIARRLLAEEATS